MHVSSWLQAAVTPARWRVAGVSCFALSVWHHFALEELRNAYAYDREADIDSAAELLMICSRNHADGRRLFTGDFYRGGVQREIYRTLKTLNSETVNLEVLDYWRTCTRIPGHKGAPVKIDSGMRIDTGADRKFIVAPQEWVLVEFFSRGDPARITAAWDMPFARARCLYDAHRNSAGEDSTLESRTDEARIDEFLSRKERAS